MTDSSPQKSRFATRLAALQPGGKPKRWVYVPYDQLSDRVGPLADAPVGDVGIVMVESAWKARRRPYHKQKLALVLANGRHFALEQAARGVPVHFVATDRPYAEVLRPVARELGPLLVMEPAELELRRELAPLAREGAVQIVEHEGWLSTPADFQASQRANKPWRMDAFYRHLRQQTGLLMENGKPAGGKYSHDAANRRPWPGDPPAPPLPQFRPDDVTIEVLELVERHFSHHPGNIDATSLPVTAEDSAALWRWAREACLPSFGPFEDAMSRRSRNLFHSRISSLLHLHRLLPSEVVADAVACDVPVESKEGFLRQVLGWREFMRHVHRETDGFRALPETEVAPSPGDGGYGEWTRASWTPTDSPTADGGAAPNALGAMQPVPPAYWGAPSGLACLDTVVESVWGEAYSHHITRLMVLSNLASLLDVEPRALTDWFWVAYSDAYDWVVEPNVLGMGTFATGALMTTKPYVSGAPYIDRMSDYCGACAFHPKKTCPVTPLYWAYLARHESRLSALPRMRVPLASLRKRSPERRARDRAVFETMTERLGRGDPVKPEHLPAP